MPPATYVAPSPIHGLGLFAAAFIPRDSVIGHLRGQACSRPGDYVLWLSADEGFEVDGDLRYINHSDSPNACYYDDLSVVALRDILPGEEITHDYGCVEW